MEIILYLGISHALFGFALLLTKRPRHISNKILGVWLLSMAIFLSGRIIPVPVVSFFKPGLFPIQLCFGPFLFLYIKSLTTEHFSLTKMDGFHFLPFLLVVLHRSFTEPVNIGPGGYDFRNENELINFVYYSLVTLSLSIYTIVAYIQIYRLKGKLPDIYSYKSSRYTLVWLSIIATMFLLFFTTFLISNYLNVFHFEWGITLSGGLRLIGFVFFIITASFFGINQPVIIATNPIKKPSVVLNKINNEGENKYMRSGLSENDIMTIKGKIVDHMVMNKPFLNPEYNINNLSDEIDVPRHHITQVINTYLEKNFYTLINEYRVNEVVERMSGKAYQNYTLLAIAFDSGFNSKSAFNRIFKQTKGKTPSEYKSFIDGTLMGDQ